MLHAQVQSNLAKGSGPFRESRCAHSGFNSFRILRALVLLLAISLMPAAMVPSQASPTDLGIAPLNQLGDQACLCILPTEETSLLRSMESGTNHDPVELSTSLLPLILAPLPSQRFFAYGPHGVPVGSGPSLRMLQVLSLR
ncbi:hypothetical protein [Polystyrenella longa]|uniref:hypothetical protein n=1 Tax=Polystyrenella longa TaxID=2528007 RepID=UPI0011A1F411|nr:hypothetical protein [Polystyrenella longa]